MKEEDDIDAFRDVWSMRNC